MMLMVWQPGLAIAQSKAAQLSFIDPQSIPGYTQFRDTFVITG